ncbi:hypothetical protein BC829DRAFT_83431 [Chytridium lagenaria]|nr:hypothetical protein BC829DRAFT_83431 [Chytridium lagenaria]
MSTDYVTVENTESRWSLAEQRFLEVFFGEDVILRTRHRRHQRRSPAKVSFNLAANIRYDFHKEPSQEPIESDDESCLPPPVKHDRIGRIARPRTAELPPELKKRLEGFRELDAIAFIKPGTAGSRSPTRMSGSGRQRKLVSLSARSSMYESRAGSPTRAASAFAFDRLRSHKPPVESADAGYVLPRRRRPLSNITRKMLLSVVKDALKQIRPRNLQSGLHPPLLGHEEHPRRGIHYYLHPPHGPSTGLSLRKHSFSANQPFGEATSGLQLHIPKALRETVNNYQRLLSPSKGTKPRIIVRDILKAYDLPKPPRLRGRLTPSTSMSELMKGTVLEQIIVPANTIVFSEGEPSERDFDHDLLHDHDNDEIFDMPILHHDQFVEPVPHGPRRNVEEAMRDVGWIFPLDYFFDQDEIDAFVAVVEQTGEVETYGVPPKKSGRILSIPPSESDEWQKVTVTEFNLKTHLFKIRWEFSLRNSLEHPWSSITGSRGPRSSFQ